MIYKTQLETQLIQLLKAPLLDAGYKMVNLELMGGKYKTLKIDIQTKQPVHYKTHTLDLLPEDLSTTDISPTNMEDKDTSHSLLVYNLPSDNADKGNLSNVAGGVSMQDCVNANKLASCLLDVEDLIPSSYQLEVSSPGPNPALMELEDFEQVIGKNIKIVLREGITIKMINCKNIKGELLSVSDYNLELKVDSKQGETMSISFSNIFRANLA